MKYWYLLPIVVTLFLAACKPKLELPEELPDCLAERVFHILEEPVWEPPAQIIASTYEGQLVFFIPKHCCDFPSELYSSDCQLLCFPDGGLGNNGDGRCMDFPNLLDEGRVMWKDQRSPTNANP